MGNEEPAHVVKKRSAALSRPAVPLPGRLRSSNYAPPQLVPPCCCSACAGDAPPRWLLRRGRCGVGPAFRDRTLFDSVVRPDSLELKQLSARWRAGRLRLPHAASLRSTMDLLTSEFEEAPMLLAPLRQAPGKAPPTGFSEAWFRGPFPAPDALPNHCCGADGDKRAQLEEMLAEPGAALVRLEKLRSLAAHRTGNARDPPHLRCSRTCSPAGAGGRAGG